MYRAKGEYAEAIAAQERALSIREAVLGPDHPNVATSLNSLGSVHYAKGDYAGALTRYERALSIREAALGPDHPHVATTLYNLGNTHHAMGDLEAALSFVERAVAIGSSGAITPAYFAESSFLLARVLWELPADAGRDRPRALRLAEAARRIHAEAGNEQAKPLAEIEAWLAGRVD